MATALGVFFIPVLYVLVAGMGRRREPRGPAPARAAEPAATRAASQDVDHGEPAGVGGRTTG